MDLIMQVEVAYPEPGVSSRLEYHSDTEFFVYKGAARGLEDKDLTGVTTLKEAMAVVDSKTALRMEDDYFNLFEFDGVLRDFNLSAHPSHL